MAKVFVLFVLLVGALVGWRVLPGELKGMVRATLGKVWGSVVIAVAVTVALVVWALTTNGKVI